MRLSNRHARADPEQAKGVRIPSLRVLLVVISGAQLSPNKKDQLELKQEGRISSAGIQGGDLLYRWAPSPVRRRVCGSQSRGRLQPLAQ